MVYGVGVEGVGSPLGEACEFEVVGDFFEGEVVEGGDEA